MSHWIAESDYGSMNTPGQQCSELLARIKRAANGQYELHVRGRWGANQGYFEEHDRVERRYRADTLNELLRIGIAEVRTDPELEGSASQLSAAIRDAVFDAQDSEATEA